MKISYFKTVFKIEAIDELILPYYKGSTFRGVFGNTFKKVVCVFKSKICDECLLKQTCVYAYVFETSPLQKDNLIFNMGKYRTIPHPFLIEPPLDGRKYYQTGDELEFSVILLGKATSYLPYFIYTFSECGKNGIGKGRGRYTLKEVLDEDGNIVYTSEESKIITPQTKTIEINEDINFIDDREGKITLHLITPIRLKNKNDLVRNLEFNMLVKALMLRLNLINFFHCNDAEAKWDHKKILEKSKEVKIIEDKTRWLDWERYSSRQQTKMKLGGIVGTITYSGSVEPYIEILRAGEILHVGKNTTFGLGKYVIEK